MAMWKLLVPIPALCAVLAVPWAFPAPILKLNMAWERWSAGLEERSIAVDTDSIVYLEGGAGDAVVLVHGFAGNKDHWTRFARFLQPHFRVIALDLPGFGQSTRDPAKRYDIPSQVERLHRFAATLGLKTFHLVGNSMGGQIAGTYAATFPGEVSSLGLFATAGIDSPREAEMARLLAAGRNPLLVDSREDFDRMLDFIFVKEPVIPGPIRTYFAEQFIKNRAFNQKIWHDLRNAKLPLETQLPKITSRTLVLWGDTDRVLDVSAVDVLRAAMPTAEVVILKDCGHVLMIERPKETAEHYLQFLGAKGPAR
jgi:abhydrolase domain-containing protein 6